MAQLATAVEGFNQRLEQYLVDQGWYRDVPSRVVGRWTGWAVRVFIGSVAVFVAGFVLPSSGAVMVGAALGISAVAIGIIGRAMPARTKDGAVTLAMLEAYRRTLAKTMALARSMDDVATTAAIPLIETPDDAVAWGVALGLSAEVEAVLERSAEDRASRGASVYVPAWYVPLAAEGHGGSAGGQAAGLAPGLMGTSPIPDFGGMVAALGTIGSAPVVTSSSVESSSFSSGSFGGGSSGGGGGGAGGGF